jgi:AcrR family transcriptional regulator
VRVVAGRDSWTLTDRTTGRAQRRPEEKRTRLLEAARTTFGETGYGASVHDICRAAGVGIGTFYHQFPDKADLMRYLMQQEHDYRIEKFDAIERSGDPAAELAQILGGSDPRLLRAMIEACGSDPRLRGFGTELRKETQERLTAAIERTRAARGSRNASLDASTAAWATLSLSDALLGRAASPETARVVAVIAFAETDGERTRA